MQIISLAMLLFGFLAGVLLYYKIPRLKSAGKTHNTVSVIIPARNEEKNIGKLLKDLARQTNPVHEIICVDDGSEDGTASVIQNFGVKYLRVETKPEGWTGKTYACQTGGDAATGDYLLFLDADVRIGPDTVEKILNSTEDGIVSVQPYHKVRKTFEHFAFFFNLVGIAANGAACPFSEKKAGLFGPVIGMAKTHFIKIGGYSEVKTSVIEDVELGRVMKQNGLGYSLFIGDKTLSFRMYHNFKDLFQGFTKNYSSGALRTPLPLLFLTFIWLTAMTAAPVLVVQNLIQFNLFMVFVSLGLYAAFVCQLVVLSAKIGSFKRIYMLVYPVFLVFFHITFIYSLYAKLFKRKVNWKGREISLK